MGTRCARLARLADAAAEDAPPAAPGREGPEAHALRSFRSASVAVAAAVRLSRHRKRLLEEEWLSEQLGSTLSQPYTQTSRSTATANSAASRRNSRLVDERRRLQDAAFTLSASLASSAAAAAAAAAAGDTPGHAGAAARQAACAPPGRAAEPQDGEAPERPLAKASRACPARRCLAAVLGWPAAAAAEGPPAREAPRHGPAEAPPSPAGARARTAPAAMLRRGGGRPGRRAPAGCGGRPERLLEMLYVVGHRATAHGGSGGSGAEPGAGHAVRHEPLVLARWGLDGGAFGDACPVPLLDERIASFCLPAPDEDGPSASSYYPPNVPFMFTVLAAVLPEDGMETAAPDPTDVLYCIAVCFDDLLCITGDAPGTATGVGPYAYCVVSRHPFVEAFGALLLRLHAGEALSLRPRPSSAALGLGIFGRSSSASHMERHEGSWPVMRGRLRLAAAHLHAARPVREERRALRRPSSAPARALAAGHAGRLSSSPSLPASAGAGPGCQRGGGESGWPHVGMFVYGAAQPGPCPAWADAQARRRCDTLAAWAGPPLFERLGVDALLRVLAALLLEMRVLVVARRVPDGSAAVFGLGSLLWPLSWQHLLLPICPLALQDAIIDAPVPFLCALREVSPHLDDTPAAPAALLPLHGDSSCAPAPHAGGTAAPCSPRSKTASTAALSEAARAYGVVICDFDRGTVKVPADFAGPLGPGAVLPAELEARRAELEGLRARLLRAPCAAERRAAAAAARGAVLCALTELAQGALDASQRAASRAEHGSGGWLSAVQDQFCWGPAGPAEADPPDGAFRREFVNTEACLVLLAAAAPAAPPHQGA